MPIARCLAASVYAELAGNNCVTKMRMLLDDQDPVVRAIAVGILARYHDADSLGRFARAVEGPQDPSIACQTIDQLSAWKDERIVPALIGFLQDDGCGYQIGDNLGIPAIYARKALAQVTGHEFPYDVAASRTAWQHAAQIRNKTERERLLEKLAPGRTPLTAIAVGLPSKTISAEFKKYFEPLGKEDSVVQIRLRNISSRPVTVLKYPSQAEIDWPAGSRGGYGDTTDEKLEFTTMQPGADIALEAVVEQSFLNADPAKRQLRLYYLANGHRQNLKAWIGVLDVEFGADWKFKRVVKHVEELWPNGNLKATGSTVNDEPMGEWNFFNDQGDRIRIEYPGTGEGTAICNPSHPDNKGAGKRPRQ